MLRAHNLLFQSSKLLLSKVHPGSSFSHKLNHRVFSLRLSKDLINLTIVAVLIPKLITMVVATNTSRRNNGTQSLSKTSNPSTICHLLHNNFNLHLRISTSSSSRMLSIKATSSKIIIINDSLIDMSIPLYL